MEQENRKASPHPQPGQKNDINKGENQMGRAGQEDTHDISHMDQQEGTMDNGALGGNFESSTEKGTDKAENRKEQNK